jgi:hypothetical protein
MNILEALILNLSISKRDPNQPMRLAVFFGQ